MKQLPDRTKALANEQSLISAPSWTDVVFDLCAVLTSDADNCRESFVLPARASLAMRDQRFVAEHRGGLLKKEQHYQLMRWACACAEHVLPLLGEAIDARLIHACAVARAWTQGRVSVGDARRASVAAHSIAREATEQTTIFVARAVGQAVATAHMADHALGPAWYGLKAIKNVGQSIDDERAWQNQQLPAEIKELVLSARQMKNI